MKSTDAPSLITTAFAQNGTRNDIPASDPGFSGDDAGRAAFTTGFPDITMRPITAGGKPPFGADFNGILYALSNAARYYGAGGHYRFNGSFAAAIGGYPIGATVQASDGMGHWLNVVDANGTDPESALSTGWIPLSDHNGTATVNLTGNVSLSASQAAKANIRLTGSIKGNLTVTFPAWTKRYSIINDCTGDQSVICTTGNGESISIKNGAKYEIGCDGKNLTVATVNASQVFAEPNKNISSLDAPTVQQVINALGSAARHNEGDFERAGAVDALTASLRDAAWHGFFDTGNADAIAYGSKDAASTGCVATVRDDARHRVDDLKHSLGTAALANIFDTGEASKIPYGKDAASTGCAASVRDENRDAIKSVRNDTDARFAQLGNASHARVVDGDYGSTYASLPFEGVGAVASTGLTRNILAKLDSDTNDKINAVKNSLRSAAFVEIFDTGDATQIEYGKQAASTGCAAAVRDFSKGLFDALKKSLGAAAWKGFFDTGNIDDVAYGYKDAASTGCVAAARDDYRHRIDDLKQSLGAAAFWGVYDNSNPDDLRDGETKLVTEGTLKGFRDRLKTPYGISTFALATRVDSSGTIKYGQTIDGRYLRTSATTYTENPTELSGTWRCLGEALDGRAGHGSRTTLWVRIS